MQQSFGLSCCGIATCKLIKVYPNHNYLKLDLAKFMKCNCSWKLEQWSIDENISENIVTEEINDFNLTHY